MTTIYNVSCIGYGKLYYIDYEKYLENKEKCTEMQMWGHFWTLIIR